MSLIHEAALGAFKLNRKIGDTNPRLSEVVLGLL
jgi:hypothetical protein